MCVHIYEYTVFILRPKSQAKHKIFTEKQQKNVKIDKLMLLQPSQAAKHDHDNKMTGNIQTSLQHLPQTSTCDEDELHHDFLQLLSLLRYFCTDYYSFVL